jgi:zinc/manganese transport system substrate-binding protein
MSCVRGWLIALLLLLGVACQRAGPTAGPATASGGGGPAPGAAAGRLPVVASFSVLADLVRSVGGERVEVTTLVGPGQDAHTFEPAPTHGAALSRATLVFENGLGFEGWLDRLYAASGSRARRVVVTEGISARKGDDADDEIDPHVWHDVQHAMHEVGVIRDALVQADPSGAATYRANAERYLAELRALDGWVVEQVRSLPEERRKLVTNHDSLGYFASRYGFAVVGAAIPGVSTETSEPSAADLAGLIGRIKQARVPALFAENASNPRVLERIAREAGVAVAPPLYTDALGQPGEPVDTYAKMVRYNVSTIVTALKA